MTASAISKYGVLSGRIGRGASKTIASCSSHRIKVCQAASAPRVKQLWETAISIARLTGELYV
jgi:hypothetical protein